MSSLVNRVFGGFFLAVSLISCGGGGNAVESKGQDSGGSSSAITPPSPVITPPPVTTQLLSMAPTTLSANVAVGASASITIRISVSNGTLPDGIVFGAVRNGGAFFSPTVELAVIDSTNISVTLHTQPHPSKGRFKGQIDLYLCDDAACLSPLAGAPLVAPFDITVDDASLQAYPIYSTAISVHKGEVLNKQLSVSVTGIGPFVNWTANSPQSWLTVQGGTGIGPGLFNLGFKTENLAEGLQSANVVVRAANGQTVNVPLQVQVLPVSFTSIGGMPSFSAVNGAPVKSQLLSFTLNNKLSVPWSVRSTKSWLQVKALAGSSPPTVSIEPDASLGSLASGNHLADLVISSAGVPDMVLTTQLALTPATLSSSMNTITLGGEKGRDPSRSQLFSLSLNTGTKAWPYTVNTLPDWLSSSSLVGTVNEIGTSISMAVRGEKIGPGSKSATVMVSSQVNGDLLKLPLTVNVNADQRRLLPSEWGVALSSSPNGTTLSRTIAIRQNFGDNLDWTASSDTAWLRVNGSGSTGSGASNLVMTADPSLVPVETVSYAKVTVRTDSPGVDPTVIRVAIWRSATGLTTIKKLRTTYNQVVADKIRPFVYARSDTGVDVFNVYTGQRISGVSGVTGSWLPMSVSPDGSRLYALNVNNIEVFDLDSLSKVATWPLVRPMNIAGPVLLAIQSPRVNGVDVVLLNDGQAYIRGLNVAKDLPFVWDGPLVTSLDGNFLYDGSGRYSLDFSEMSGGVLFFKRLNDAYSHTGPNLMDIAVAEDGHHGYAAAGAGVYENTIFLGYHCSAYDPTSSEFKGLLYADAYPNNVEITRDGRVLCGVTTGSGAFDFRLYTSDGTLVRSFRVSEGRLSGLRSGQLVATSDGFAVTAITEDGFLAFVPIGP